MAALKKIDSNLTGLRYAKETSIGVLPGSPTFYPVEPNTYKDFGGQLTLVARRPINPSRQLKKGVITDLNAGAGYTTDVTQTSLQDLLQGFMFAATRNKGLQVATAVTSALYNIPATAGFKVGSLVNAAGFSTAGNNGVKKVTAVVVNTSIAAAGLTAEGSPPATNSLQIVGFEGASADLTINAAGALPVLGSTALDFTTLGLVVGEWIFIGGDAAGNQFATAANNGFARVRAVTATAVTLDKTAGVMVTDSGSGKTIRLYFGKVLKNEQSPLIVRQSYALERTLSFPDDSSPSAIQSEYVHGAVPNELILTIPTANKMTSELTFVGTTYETRSAGTGVIAGTRPSLVDTDAFNTSSDFARIKLSVLDQANSDPLPLFAYLTTLTLTVKNNVTPSKAVGTLGAFDVNVGVFEVTGQMTAYFADVAAIAAVQANQDASLEFQLVKNNAGMAVDLPLVALGDARANVVLDKAIELPLTMDAASSAKIDSNLNHTLLFCFYDYLPTLAHS